jgi:hypothetical protein
MFNTALDDDPLDGQVEFATIPGGLNYAARTTVNVPETAVRENRELSVRQTVNRTRADE